MGREVLIDCKDMGREVLSNIPYNAVRTIEQGLLRRVRSAGSALQAS